MKTENDNAAEGVTPVRAGFYWVRNVETIPVSRWEVCEVRPELTRSGFMAYTAQYPDGFFIDEGGLEWVGPICEPNVEDDPHPPENDHE
jgi:hypothetical protein